MNPLLRPLVGGLLAGVTGLSMAACSTDLATGPAEPVGGNGMQAQLGVVSNDDFDDAVIISRPTFTHSVNTSEATTAADDPVPSCAEGGRGPTVWYAFTPKASKRIEANTFGSDYDTDLVVYTGTRGNLTEIICNDDAQGLQSKVVFDAVAGETYYIMVGAWNSGPGGNLVFNLRSPSAEVFRDRFFHDAALVHIIPEYNLTFTVGLITPIADLAECGGPQDFLSDVETRIQNVETPQGPIKVIEYTRGTFVLYDVSLFELEEFCDLAQFEIGRGTGSFSRLDNSLTGVGPGNNSFGFVARAALTLTDGDRARFLAVFRQFFDGVDEVTTVVDKVQLK